MEATESLAGWPAPAWATCSYSDEGGVYHSWTHPITLAEAFPSRREFQVELAACDAVEAAGATVRVARTAPVVMIDGLALSPHGALHLVQALQETLERLHAADNGGRS